MKEKKLQISLTRKQSQREQEQKREREYNNVWCPRDWDEGKSIIRNQQQGGLSYKNVQTGQWVKQSDTLPSVVPWLGLLQDIWDMCHGGQPSFSHSSWPVCHNCSYWIITLPRNYQNQLKFMCVHKFIWWLLFPGVNSYFSVCLGYASVCMCVLHVCIGCVCICVHI